MYYRALQSATRSTAVPPGATGRYASTRHTTAYTGAYTAHIYDIGRNSKLIRRYRSASYKQVKSYLWGAARERERMRRNVRLEAQSRGSSLWDTSAPYHYIACSRSPRSLVVRTLEATPSTSRLISAAPSKQGSIAQTRPGPGTYVLRSLADELRVHHNRIHPNMAGCRSIYQAQQGCIAPK